MSEKKYIEELFTDSGPVDEKEVVEVVRNFIVINQETHEIYFKEAAKKLTVEEKILAYGLAKKLLKLGSYVNSEEISAKEIKDLGIKSGSVDSAFKSLREESGYLIGSGSKYVIPNYKVKDALKELKKKSEIAIKNE